MVDELEQSQQVQNPEDVNKQFEEEAQVGGSDGLSDEQVEQSQEQTTQEEVQSKVEEKKEEIPSWAFNKMSKKIKSEVERAVTGSLQAILQQPYTPPVAPQAVDPYAAQAHNPYGYEQGAYMTEQQKIEAGIQSYLAKQAQLQQMKAEEDKKRAFNEQVEAARDKFDDYDDFVAEASPHFTAPMYGIVSEIPGGVENFKIAWGEHKDEIMKLKNLSPFRQAAELQKILDNVELKKAEARYKPTSSKPISPLKSSSSDATKETTSSFMDSVRARYKRL